MSRYQLPDEAVRGISPLARISTESAQALAAELQQQLKLSFSFTDEVKRIVGASSIQLDPEERNKLAQSIVGIHYLKHGFGVPLNEFLAEVRLSIESARDHIADPTLFETNLRTFLEVRTLEAAVKSWSLRTDHENIFLRSKIFTDVRPVFSEQLDEPLLASLLTHTVKLSYRKNGEQETVFIVADSEDLRELQKDIGRALDKAHALNKLIAGHSERFGPALDQDSDER